MTTPADELRQAAATIREVAAKASPGPWWNDDHEIYTVDRDWVAESCDVDNPELATGNGAHIAMWHPGMTILVADFLDAVGKSIDGLDLPEASFRQEIAIARAINGGVK